MSVKDKEKEKRREIYRNELVSLEPLNRIKSRIYDKDEVSINFFKDESADEITDKYF